jgi:tetratricopeptide (TPR) repeat protein
MESPLATAKVDLQSLEGAVAAHPGDAAAVLRLANGLHDNGMIPRAIEQYQKYLKMHPDDADARVDFGICYDQMGMADSAQSAKYYGLAIQEMERALKGTPGHQPAAFNLGIVNLHRGQLEESNAWFKKAVALNKSSELGMRAQQILQQHSFTP